MSSNTGMGAVRTPGRDVTSRLGVFALVVVVAAPALASWHGLVATGRGLLGLSGAWAYLVPLVLDAAALYAAVLSLRSVLAGDSALVDRALVWLYAAAAAALNAWYAAKTSTPSALFFGGASVSAVLLWDRTLRAHRRDALRELGAIEAPLPRFRALRWLVAPGETARAWRAAIVEGVTSPEDALRIVRAERLDRPAEVAEVATSGAAELAESPAPVIPSPRAEVEPDAELLTMSKTDAMRAAWRALGVQGVPQTRDVVPAMRWLAERGVVVDRSRAYEIRRRVEAQLAATPVLVAARSAAQLEVAK